MDELTRFGSALYCLYLGMLGFARGADFLSTYIATPNLVLEANPLAKKMGWKVGALLNVHYGALGEDAPACGAHLDRGCHDPAARPARSVTLGRSARSTAMTIFSDPTGS